MVLVAHTVGRFPDDAEVDAQAPVCLAPLAHRPVRGEDV